MSWLIPHISRHDVAPMLGIAAVGAVVAGCYGIIHDEVTYSISPEYFTRLKFDQFAYADLGLPPRCFVAQIGFLATWWVGFLAAWFLARIAVPGQPRNIARRQVASGFCIVLSAAILAGAAGFALGLWRGPAADFSHWRPLAQQLGVHDLWSFVRVAYIHNAGYLGALLGLLLALAHVYTQKCRVPVRQARGAEVG